MQRALDWHESAIVAIDQTALPEQVRMLRLSTVDDVIDAITRLAVRGAPAIGVAGGLGVALAARSHRDANGRIEMDAVRADARRLIAARPTAVNLRWAVERVVARLPQGSEAVLIEALAVLEEDERINRAAARLAADTLLDLHPGGPLRVLTHCNTGSLATVGWGTALGAIRELAGQGLIEEVLATETRPLLQGARLTVWELGQAGIPHRLCVDSAGPAAIAAGLVDAVIVGADRVAANGDVANKIGTYSLACAAARSGVPFIVVAPRSTHDQATSTGARIPIEERDPAEVRGRVGAEITVPETAVYNPAFDITPAELITAVVSELDVRWLGRERLDQAAATLLAS